MLTELANTFIHIDVVLCTYTKSIHKEEAVEMQEFEEVHVAEPVETSSIGTDPEDPGALVEKSPDIGQASYSSQEDTVELITLERDGRSALPCNQKIFEVQAEILELLVELHNGSGLHR